MKLAILTDGIYPHVVGGMQRHSGYLVKYLAASGVQIDLYHPEIKGLNKEAILASFSGEEQANIELITIPQPDFGKAPGHYIRESYEYAVRIAKEVERRERVDFIYAKGFTAWELLSRKIKGHQLPLIGVNLHGLEMFQRQPDWWSGIKSKLLLQAPARYSLKHADVLFSYGARISELLQKEGVAPHRIVEVPTGITSDWISTHKLEMQAPRRFVFIGRDERRKGIAELYETIKSLSMARSAEFHFVGAFKTKLKQYGVHYHGEIRDNNRLKAILDASQVLLCPSHSEGMPNVIMEAMARGCAVLATDVGAVGTVVNTDTGWLIPAGNQRVLQQTLADAITIPDEQLIKKRTAARTLLQQHYLWENIAQRTRSAIEKIVRSQDFK